MMIGASTILLYCYLLTCCTSHLASCTTTTKSISPSRAAALAATNEEDSLLSIPSPANTSNNNNNNNKQPAHEGESQATREESTAEKAANLNLNHHQELTGGDVHKLMSEQDLRRTFQVNSHDQVPEYEILKLTVQDDEELDKSIVMKLSTFGKDYKLRLKRNSDFQQRIKDMKMFMAESTKDGQLRYTEIKGQLNKQQQQQQQQPVTSDLTTSYNSSNNNNNNNTTNTNNSKQQQRADIGNSTKEKEPKQDNVEWNIGSTYHDEDNLAALLIDHDRKTGQLQVDGTIGNDFVIKPMPKSTIDALVIKRRQEQLERQRQQQVPARSDRQAVASSNAIGQALEANQSSAPSNTSSSNNNNPTAAALHMHDDDPHDDDEMFLDEDEALELASQHQSANRTEAGQTASSTQQQQLPQTARSLSKAASERKWKKYRKLMAQTQVPKPNAMASEQSSSAFATPPHEGAGQQRHRRAAYEQQDDSSAKVIELSHHIVYRQRPSSEGSSSEHQHSFMVAPGEFMSGSMEQLAGRLRRQQSEEESRPANETPESVDDEQGADFAHDPLGGQFYLEPASVTGVGRAGYADWSLLGGQAPRAPPPYALNGSTPVNGTQLHARYKRHALMRAGMSQVRRKRQAPDTVWPEVLLVVDYDSFLLHGGDSRDVKRYFVSFWNGVDLRYKLLVHPHIRISLAGMIVAKDRDATPYLERNRLRAPNADAVDAAGALTDMGKYLYREDRLPTYDLAVVITKLDMCRRRFEGGRCNRGTAGFAYVGGACVVNKRLEKVNSVAIIEDSGGFSGIIVAAHEVGHLLGCVHDGSPPPSYLGGPGATHCPWEDGFIMSDLRHTERGFRWSQCSIEQFKHFLNGETATCLYNYPHESQMLHRILPGTMLSLDEQCKRDRGTNACFKDARVCAQLFCFDSASGYCVSYRPAAEGSPCGEGQVCRNGKCVGEIENIIPDYTHQSQTVVAARRPVVHHGRLAAAASTNDNGLSASSTSTATSSPEAGKPLAAGAQQQQLTSRMDTFPIDTPLSSTSLVSGGYSGSFGGRYATANNGDSMMLRQASSPSSLATQMKGSKLVAAADKLANSGYQQRSGHQAAPRLPANQKQVSLEPRYATTTSVKSSTRNNKSNRQQLHPHNSKTLAASTTVVMETSPSNRQFVDSVNYKLPKVNCILASPC